MLDAQVLMRETYKADFDHTVHFLGIAEKSHGVRGIYVKHDLRHVSGC